MDNGTPPKPGMGFSSFLATIKSEDADRYEELSTAVSYLETSMAQLRVCIAALRHEGSALAKDIASKLDDDVHNDIDNAREMVQDWQQSYKEVRHG